MNQPAAPSEVSAGTAATTMSGAEAVVGTLKAHGVEVIFGLCGDTSLPFYDALARLPHGMRHVLTRDERYVVIPDARAETVRVFEAASGEETGRLDFAGGGPQGVTLYTDDRTLFVALSRAGKIAVVDIQTMQLLGEYQAGRGPDGIGLAK